MKEDPKSPPASAPAGAVPMLHIDYEYYAKFLEDVDATDDEKRELIEAIWNVIVEFISLGFHVHPMQQAGLLNAEPDRDNNEKELPPDLPDVLGSTKPKTNKNKNGRAASSPAVLPPGE